MILDLIDYEPIFYLICVSSYDLWRWIEVWSKFMIMKGDQRPKYDMNCIDGRPTPTLYACYEN